MTYIGSMAMAGMKAKDDAEREQMRIQGFSPEGVEDFAAKWFSAINPFIGGMPSDDQAAQDCANAFQGLAQQMGAIGTAMNTAQQEAFGRVFSAPLEPPAMAEAAAKIEAHLARDAQKIAALIPEIPATPEEWAKKAQFRELPFIAVPRSAPTPEAQRIAALEAELAAARAALAAAATQAVALVGQNAEPAQHPLKRAVAAWPGYGGIDQLTGKPTWV